MLSFKCPGFTQSRFRDYRDLKEMTGTPIAKEQYINGNSVIDYLVYPSSVAVGNDEVMQHRVAGAEVSQLTLHPNGIVNFRIVRSKSYLENAVKNDLMGYTPEISEQVKQFITRVRPKIA
jgi:hypothetical protein